jgi:hypothetical protein
MDTPNNTKSGLGLVGAGAAACVACCAAPIAGFLAATGIASLLGAVVFGALGLVVVLAVSAVLWQRCRRQQTQCAPTNGPVAVETPLLKTRR